MDRQANATRRTFLKALGIAAAGTTTSTVAVAEVAKPVSYKVGSPSFSVPPDVMVAIKNWQRANEAKKEALAAYVAYQRTLPANMCNVTVYPETKNAYFDADEAAMQAQFALLDLLESYAEAVQ